MCDFDKGSGPLMLHSKSTGFDPVSFSLFIEQILLISTTIPVDLKHFKKKALYEYANSFVNTKDKRRA